MPKPLAVELLLATRGDLLEDDDYYERRSGVTRVPFRDLTR